MQSVRALGLALGQLHKEFGVGLVCNARVTGFGGEIRVQSVRLADGRELPADIVVVGIGVLPNTEWLADSGLRLTMGFCVTGRSMQDQKRYTLPAMAWRGQPNGGRRHAGRAMAHRGGPGNARCEEPVGLRRAGPTILDHTLLLERPIRPPHSGCRAKRFTFSPSLRYQPLRLSAWHICRL
ncbi:FAD-dependent oxidoreductase [Paraburkholderia phytofirmans]|uniref:FAD-dependent oxidoreductase n=1 Tax=Paraburkholderia phytofirmans TaxID=261302 RepID=UPI001427B630